MTKYEEAVSALKQLNCVEINFHHVSLEIINRAIRIAIHSSEEFSSDDEKSILEIIKKSIASTSFRSDVIASFRARFEEKAKEASIEAESILSSLKKAQ